VDRSRRARRTGFAGVAYDGAGQGSLGRIRLDWKFCVAYRAHGLRFAVR